MVKTDKLHRLSPDALASLAAGPGSPATIRTLCRAELSKHLLLVAGVVTTARREHADAYGAAHCAAGFDLLVRVQAHAPGATARVLALPQVGAWAMDCMDRMWGARGGGGPPHTRPLWADLGYLNAIAVAAALQAGHPFDLVVPVRHGRLVLPQIGTLRLTDTGPESAGAEGHVRIRSARAPQVTGDSAAAAPVDIVAHAGTARQSPLSWSPAHRIRTRAAGLTLDVALDNQDPFLDRYGQPIAGLADRAPRGAAKGDRGEPGSPAQGGGWTVSWNDLVAGAWRLLAAHHRDYAAAIAAGLRTIVPLVCDRPGHRVGSVSCLAFGAVATSLPADEVRLAETLVHEFQHVKLGAVADLAPLTRPGWQAMYYAPWRDDPRPGSALLQGIYAFFGIADFWRTQRHLGQPAAGLRGHIEFVRWRSAVLRTARTLASSGGLTAVGSRFVETILGTLRGWGGDPVPERARRLAAESLAAHHLTWRAGHLLPPEEAVDRLADIWADGAHRGNRPGPVDAAVAPRPGWPDQAAQARMRMLEMRYFDPSGFSRWLRGGAVPAGLSRPDTADEFLLRNQTAKAVTAYRQRIAADQLDRGAWAGLALIAWRRVHRFGGLAGHRPPASADGAPQPELACALHARLRERTGQSPDPVALVEWTAPADATAEPGGAGPAGTP